MLARAALVVLVTLLPGCVLTTTLDAELAMPTLAPQRTAIIALDEADSRRSLRVLHRATTKDGEIDREVSFAIASDVAVVDSRVCGPIELTCVHAVGLADATKIEGDYRVQVFDGRWWRDVGAIAPVLIEKPAGARFAFWALLPLSLALDVALSPIEFALFWTPLVKTFDRP